MEFRKSIFESMVLFRRQKNRLDESSSLSSSPSKSISKFIHTPCKSRRNVSQKSQFPSNGFLDRAFESAFALDFYEEEEEDKNIQWISDVVRESKSA
jgi:hypothetical protein